MSRSAVTVANEQTPIVLACRMAGVELPDDPAYGRSMKVYCPFGDMHSDGGREKALRVYVDSNSAWCFACQSYFTPVKIVAQARALDWATAASVLLDHIGYREASPDEQFAALADPAPRIDKALLADALKVYCRRAIPGWQSRQFDRAEAALLTRCLALLDRVGTEEEAQTWLAVTKHVMVKECGAAQTID